MEIEQKGASWRPKFLGYINESSARSRDKEGGLK